MKYKEYTKDILKYFPYKISEKIESEIDKLSYNFDMLEEVRIRNNNPIILKFNNREKIIENYTSSKEEIEYLVQKLCNNSIYSYQNEIINGYITVKGGHRVGITGEIVLDRGNIINVKNISSLNFRIAHQVIDCSNFLLKYILNIDNNEIYNTLIVSCPGAGKTTILRDLVRKISSGIPEYSLNAKTCGIIDERGEIAAMYKGLPQNDIGVLSDVIENSPKYIGMSMLIRSMSPDIIVCDEIGNEKDIEAINYAICSGVKGIFTLHASNIEDIFLNNKIKELLEKYIIETIIFLDENKRGNIKEIYKLNKENKSYIKVLK